MAVRTALAAIAAWTYTVPDSAMDAYSWEVERPVDKRVILPQYLHSDSPDSPLAFMAAVAVAAMMGSRLCGSGSDALLRVVEAPGKRRRTPS